ncbi:MAG TPA: flagellar motor stator protein MotA [Bacteroidota bacterium]|nr:flagellar motor stator protein MotA [Bacteroidota bacterium]
MFVIIGIAVVIIGVLGGFMMHGGSLAVLLQWNEFLIIGGSGVGSLLVGTPPRVLRQIAGNIAAVIKGDRYGKPVYLQILQTMYELFTVATRDGLINIESHIEEPEKSAIFSKNPFLLAQKHALHYLCDTMKLLLGGGIQPHDLEGLLDADIETSHAEHNEAPVLIQKLGDALPGLGIVAAVLGIVITMQAIDGPPEEIGHKVAAALVGTFLGVLMSYGFVQPIASHLELLHQSESRYLECIKTGIVAYAKGNAPSMVVEFARRVIYNDVRPSFDELEEAVRSLKSAPQAVPNA